jgi:pathogenesis-related protein 1
MSINRAARQVVGQGVFSLTFEGVACRFRRHSCVSRAISPQRCRCAGWDHAPWHPLRWAAWVLALDADYVYNLENGSQTDKRTTQKNDAKERRRRSRRTSMRKMPLTCLWVLVAAGCSSEVSSHGVGGSGGSGGSDRDAGGATGTGGARGSGGMTGSGGSSNGRGTGGGTATGGAAATGGATGSGGAATGPGGQGGHTNPLGQAQIDAFVLAHNQARGGPLNPTPSPALPPVTWDPVLADVAYNYLSKCQGTPLVNHNANRTTDYAALGGTVYVGENIFGTTANTVSPADAVSSWMSEAPLFDYATGDFGAAGHYTQIVWRTSVRIGCAIVNCPTTIMYHDSVLCDYAPGGNIIGQKPY